MYAYVFMVKSIEKRLIVIDETPILLTNNSCNGHRERVAEKYACYVTRAAERYRARAPL